MASPQTGNGFIRIANELWDEIIRRDFSKRQKDIINLIWRLSYGCNKRTAFIPRLVYFELCGIGKNHIREELQYLETCRVIFWDRDERTFEVNKDHELWKVSPVKGWKEFKFDELLHLNVQKSSQNGNEKVPETGTEKFPNQELSNDSENEKFPKQEQFGSQNGNSEVPKTGTTTPDEPNLDKGSRVSKDSIKDSKDSKEIKKDNVVNDIVSYLNERANKHFSPKTKSTVQHINARLSEGRTIDDFKHVIDVKVVEWLNNPKMNQYLRPETLFAPTNFESYLNQPMPVNSGSQPSIREMAAKLQRQQEEKRR